MLMDEHGNTIGEIVSSDIEVGEVLCSFPLGNTRPRSGTGSEPHRHSHGVHDEPSGPGFYAEMRGMTGEETSHVHEHSASAGAKRKQDELGAKAGAPFSKSGIDLALQRIEGELRALAGLVRVAAQREERS